MKHLCNISAAVLLAAVLFSEARGGGYGQFPAYSGPKLPASGAVFVVVPTADAAGSDVAMGWYLDSDGDGRADVADVAMLRSRQEGVGRLLSVHVSPASRNVVYAVEEPLNGPRVAVLVLERVGEEWRRVGQTPIPFPDEILEIVPRAGSLSPPVSSPIGRYFFSAFSNVVSVRRMPNGSDAALGVGTFFDARTFRSRYALLVDGADSDPYADHWSEVEEIPDAEAFVLDDRGGVVARRINSIADPRGTSAFVRIAPATDAATGEPKTPFVVEASVASGEGTGAHGWGDLDYGLGRVMYATDLGTVDVDSFGRLIPGSVRDLENVRLGGTPWSDIHPVLRADGRPVAYGQGRATYGVAAWLDEDFDGRTDNFFDGSTRRSEHSELLFVGDVPGVYILNVSVAQLERVQMGPQGAEIRFAEHGVYPGGRSFTFRLSGRDRDRLWVGPKGVASFSRPVVGNASADTLAATRGVIAAAWSDGWDATQAQVFAGYAPATRNDAGETVLAFIVEWRGLRAPGWDNTRSFSVRLVLFSDGGYRTDFGAIDEASTPFVTGRSGIGNHAAIQLVDASAHSWGGSRAGSLSDRVLAESFASANDLGHIPVRWSGYPERLDAAAPAPGMAGARVANGKISIPAAGSNIVQGAVVVVDGTESFQLTRNKSGSKWVAKKTARSATSGRTLGAVLAGGGPHSIRVVNPDGESSPTLTL